MTIYQYRIYYEQSVRKFTYDDVTGICRIYLKEPEKEVDANKIVAEAKLILGGGEAPKISILTQKTP